MTDPTDWQAWNRRMNGSVPMHDDGLTFAQEKVQGYDCKGFVVLKARDLQKRGVELSRMKALSVAGGVHMVLQVDDMVFDDETPWVQKPGDYQITVAVPLSLLFELMPQIVA